MQLFTASVNNQQYRQSCTQTLTAQNPQRDVATILKTNERGEQMLLIAVIFQSRKPHHKCEHSRELHKPEHHSAMGSEECHYIGYTSAKEIEKTASLHRFLLFVLFSV